EILEDSVEQMRVALGAHPVPHRDFYGAVRLALLQIVDYLSRDLAQVHLAALQLPARNAREVEQAFDQQPHLLGGAAYPVEIAPSGLGQMLGEIVDERLAESVDRAQRRAQVVGHRVGERLELLVRR